MARTAMPGRREALLEAAGHVLSLRGLEGTTVAEITRKAGVAHGTFYLYFRSKDAITAALQQRFADQLAETIAAQEGGADANSLSGRLQALLDTAADAYLSNESLHNALASIETADLAEPQWYNSIVSGLTDLIVSGQNTGAFAVDDARLTAALIFSAIHGLFHQALSDPSIRDRKRLIAAAWQLISRVLCVEKKPSSDTSKSKPSRA